MKITSSKSWFERSSVSCYRLGKCPKARRVQSSRVPLRPAHTLPRVRVRVRVRGSVDPQRTQSLQGMVQCYVEYAFILLSDDAEKLHKQQRNCASLAPGDQLTPRTQVKPTRGNNLVILYWNLQQTRNYVLKA